MRFGQDKIIVLSTYTFGDVRLKYDLKGPRKKNWTPKQSMVTLLDTLNTTWGYKFYDPTLKTIFETGT